MGNSQFVLGGRKGGKTTANLEGLKKYLGGFTKKERKQIEKELEQDKDAEEEPNGYAKAIPSGQFIDWADNSVFSNVTFTTEPKFYRIVNGNWEPAENNNAKEQEVIDVNFEE